MPLLVVCALVLMLAGGSAARPEGNLLPAVKRANLAYHNAVARRDAGAVASLYTPAVGT